MLRKLTLASAAFLLATAAVAHADDASKRAKVEQVFDLANVNVISERMLSTVPERVRMAASHQSVAMNATTPEQQKLTKDYVDQMDKIARSGANWATLKPKVVELYMNAFTEEDLDGMIAFYKTQAGKDFVAKTPDLTGQTIQVLQSSVTSLQPQFEAATKAYQTSMKNAAPPPSNAAPQKAPTLGPETPANTAKPAPASKN